MLVLKWDLIELQSGLEPALFRNANDLCARPESDLQTRERTRLAEIVSNNLALASIARSHCDAACDWIRYCPGEHHFEAETVDMEFGRGFLGGVRPRPRRAIITRVSHY